MEQQPYIEHRWSNRFPPAMFGVIIFLFCLRFTQTAPPSSSLCSISSSKILCDKQTTYLAPAMKRLVIRQPEMSNTLRRRCSKGSNKDQWPNCPHSEKAGLPRVGPRKNKNQRYLDKGEINLEFTQAVKIVYEYRESCAAAIFNGLKTWCKENISKHQLAVVAMIGIIICLLWTKPLFETLIFPSSSVNQ